MHDSIFIFNMTILPLFETLGSLSVKLLDGAALHPC
jgi:hypothetical protein